MPVKYLLHSLLNISEYFCMKYACGRTHFTFILHPGNPIEKYQRARAPHYIIVCASAILAFHENALCDFIGSRVCVFVTRIHKYVTRRTLKIFPLYISARYYIQMDSWDFKFRYCRLRETERFSRAIFFHFAKILSFSLCFILFVRKTHYSTRICRVFCDRIN